MSRYRNAPALADDLHKLGKPQIRCTYEKLILLRDYVVILVHDKLVSEELGLVLFGRHVGTQEFGEIQGLLNCLKVPKKMHFLSGGDLHSRNM